MLRREVLVKSDVSEELSASMRRVTRIGELGTLVATSNRRTLLVAAVTLLMEAIHFLHETHGVTSQKTEFFIDTAVKTSNLI
jgi:hypothetical protein